MYEQIRAISKMPKVQIHFPTENSQLTMITRWEGNRREKNIHFWFMKKSIIEWYFIPKAIASEDQVIPKLSIVWWLDHGHTICEWCDIRLCGFHVIVCRKTFNFKRKRWQETEQKRATSCWDKSQHYEYYFRRCSSFPTFTLKHVFTLSSISLHVAI